VPNYPCYYYGGSYCYEERSAIQNRISVSFFFFFCFNMHLLFLSGVVVDTIVKKGCDMYYLLLCKDNGSNGGHQGSLNRCMINVKEGKLKKPPSSLTINEAQSFVYSKGSTQAVNREM
jgi:hypothetical protein